MCIFINSVSHLQYTPGEQPLVEPKNPKITGPWLVLLEMVVWGELYI